MSYPKSLALRGMSLTWNFHAGHCLFRLFAPTQGWVAVGFNLKSGLAGTNLIMGAVLPDGGVRIQDRYIIQAGLHKSKAELDAVDRLTKPMGIEGQYGTTIEFLLPLKSDDNYSHTLIKGQLYHVLLAYSTHDDFMHHSRMRTHTTLYL